jgi:phospholipid/cholesterol/gamma-HCH transport system substrate-binding protein
MKLTAAEKLRLTVFLATGAVLIFTTVVILAGLRIIQAPDRYLVEFDESVTGLEVGASVRYQGLRVGSVEIMRINPEDPQLIEVQVALDHGTVLYEGTEAVLDLSGLTGLRTVNLVPGDPRAGVIAEGSIIPSTPSLVGQLGDRAEQIAERIVAVTDRIALWTRDANRQRFERLLDHVDALIVDADDALVTLKEPTKNAVEQGERTLASIEKLADRSRVAIDRLSPEAKRLLVSTRRTMDELDRVLSAVDDDKVESIVASIASATDRLDQLLAPEQFGRVVADARIALERLASILDETDLVLRASREDFILSLKQIRQASQELREFSRIIAQDPSTLIRGTEIAE